MARPPAARARAGRTAGESQPPRCSQPFRSSDGRHRPCPGPRHTRPGPAARSRRRPCPPRRRPATTLLPAPGRHPSGYPYRTSSIRSVPLPPLSVVAAAASPRSGRPRARRSRDRRRPRPEPVLALAPVTVAAGPPQSASFPEPPSGSPRLAAAQRIVARRGRRSGPRPAVPPRVSESIVPTIRLAQGALVRPGQRMRGAIPAAASAERRPAPERRDAHGGRP